MSTDPSFRIRSLTAPEYVRELFEPSDNAAVLVRNRETGKTIQRIARAETVAGPEFQAWLATRSAAGSDVYVGMNPLKEGAYGRTKDHIKEIRHVYLDLDRTGDVSLQMIHSALEIPAPNFVLDTSPGKHQVVWRVRDFTMEEAESLLRKLATHCGGDPAATDSTRVLRLPGFANRKLPEEFIVRAHQESGSVHHLQDFAIYDDPAENTRDFGSARGQRKTPTDHKSQSERDWAYAKRALARGDDFEDVVRRIADYRADDKTSPETYARRTAAKARAELEREPSKSK
jgi:hypothetical protein